MNLKSPKAFSLFESLESRLFFSIVPAPALAVSAKPLSVGTLSSSVTAEGGTGITGQYFTGDFVAPLVVRTDKLINFNWINGRPDQVIPKGLFSARWTGQIEVPVTGTYTFSTNSDAGTSVIINGTTLFDNLPKVVQVDSEQTAALTSGSIALTAGQKVSLQVEYVSTGHGSAKMQLLWSGPGIRTSIVPRSALFPDSTVALPAVALTGNYFVGDNFNTPVMTRSDTIIDFDWGTGTPDSVIPQHTKFSVRWIGKITAPTTGVYTFKSIADDGVRLWVNGQLIINHFQLNSGTPFVGKIALQAGQQYDLRMDYFENGTGVASAKLLWALPGQRGFAGYTPFNSPTPVPAAPTVSTTAITANEVDLVWNNPSYETGFVVERSGDNGATFTQIGTTAQGITTFADTTAAPNTSYEYEVIATGAAGNSLASAPADALTLPLPVVASATVSGTTATVSWTTPVTSTVIHYLIERSPDGITGWTSLATNAGNSYQDTTLAAATTYYYRVTASDMTGSAAPSNVVSVTTVPLAPIGLTATSASPTQINLQWNDVTGETGFIVQASANGTTGWTQIGNVGTGVTTFGAAGLTPSTQYFFRVIAIDAGGDSGPSNVANATTGAPNPSYATLTTLYGLTGNGKVYSIDTGTGAVAQIGTLSFGTNAAGRDPYSSDFYYISTGSSNVAISAWNPFDGSNTVVAASVPLSGPVALAAFATDGTFFMATDLGDLYAFDVDTDVATLKGNIHANGSTLATGNGDFAFAPNGTLYLETSSELYSIPRASIDAGTGSGSIITATDIGSTGGSNLQLAFGQNGVLFGTDAAGQLYSVNPTTAVSTPIGSPSGVNMGDLASVPLYSQLTVGQVASTFTRGAAGSYTLTVNNGGPDTNVGPITVVDTLPAGVTFTSGAGTGWTFSVNGQVITMTYTGNVAPNAAAPAVTLNVAVGSGVPSNVVNAVTVMSSVFQTNTAANSGSLSTPVSG